VREAEQKQRIVQAPKTSGDWSDRRCLLLAALAMAGALCLASTAWACTSVMGNLTITPSSGNRGTAITANATALKAYPAKYRLRFANPVEPTGNCMATDTTATTLVKGIRTTSSGSFSNVRATIPSAATRGQHEICAMETYPVPNQTGTQHMIFTVI
jgi:hypothetical protein